MTETANDIRLFTVARANRALPLVRRIVADVLTDHPRWKDAVARYELVAAGARPEGGETPELMRLRREVDDLAARIEGYAHELAQIGCEMKGFDQGLVDFYGLYQGRLVCLCWKYNEESVTHWHELDAGYAGRQPITPEFAAAQSDDLPDVGR